VTDQPVDRRRLVLVSAISSLLIGVTGLVAYFYGGDVPRGTFVLGVDIGGKSREDAERVLHEHFDARAGEPVEVLLGDRRVVISPAAIAMTLDVNLTVGKAMRGSPRLSGQRASPPVINLDKDLLVEQLGGQVRPNRAATAVRGAWLTGHAAVIPPAPSS